MEKKTKKCGCKKPVMVPIDFGFQITYELCIKHAKERYGDVKGRVGTT